MIFFPKISIITPSYNQAQFLEKTIESVVNQNYPNIEYIIIDGGSTDGSVEIIKKYASKIYYWESKKDEGQSFAINRGLSLASGEIVTWLNSDDYYLPETLKKVAEYWNKQPFHFLVGNCYFVDENGIQLSIQNKSKLINNNYYLPFTNKCIINQPGSFFSLAIFKQLGPLDTNLHYSMDVDFWLKIASSNYKFDYIDEYLCNFRRHPKTKSALGNLQFIEETMTSYFFTKTLPLLNPSYYSKSKKICIDSYLYHLRIDHQSSKLYRQGLKNLFNEPTVVIKHLFLYSIKKVQLFLCNKLKFN